jgi:hypothetical protein
MLEAKCPKCGARYYGWALRLPRNQMCGNCGVGLEITDENGQTFTGYSLLTAEEYKFKPSENVRSKESQRQQ